MKFPFSKTAQFPEFRRLLPSAILVGLLVGVSFFAGYLFREAGSTEFFQFPIAREAFLLLRDRGLKALPGQAEMEYGMIRGMLQAYDDPYTIFVEPPQAELQLDQLQGKFGGIGIRIEKDSAGDVLIYPLPGSPALAAGVRDGDRLLKVDQLRIAPETTTDEIQAAIRGPVGKPVTITIKHQNIDDEILLRIERMEVPLPSVTYNLASFDPSIGVVQLNIVAETSPEEVSDAVDQLRSQGATGFILDLRNNGGGLVEAGVEVARLFLQPGVILVEQFKGQSPVEFKVENTGQFYGLPLVAVVNQNTASAAEIIAGALRKFGSVKLVGNKTFGKDSVQLVFDLQDSSSLHVTAGRWWLPGDQTSINAKGLPLDLVLSDDEANSAAALEKAARLLPGR